MNPENAAKSATCTTDQTFRATGCTGRAQQSVDGHKLGPNPVAGVIWPDNLPSLTNAACLQSVPARRFDRGNMTCILHATQSARTVI